MHVQENKYVIQKKQKSMLSQQPCIRTLPSICAGTEHWGGYNANLCLLLAITVNIGCLDCMIQPMYIR